MRINRIFICLLAVIGIFTSCLEEQSGCIDSRASNYDVSADDPCDDCCNYPSIKITFRHVFDTLNFSTSSVYEDSFGNDYQLQDFAYFISSPALVDSEGTEYPALEKIEAICLSGTSELTDSIPAQVGLVNSITEVLTFDRFPASGGFEELRFQIGLGVCTNHVDTNSIEEDNLLRLDPDSLYIDQLAGFNFARFFVLRDTGNQDISLLEWSGDSEIIAISVSGDILVSKGDDADLDVAVDIKKWFNSVDIVNDSNAEIVSKLKTNAINAFALE